MPQITVQGPNALPVTYRVDHDVITIGRSSSNHLVIQDPMMSRLHAEIRREGSSWVVEDKGSANGTRLNGKRLAEARPLAPDDRITIGDTVIVFDAADPKGPGAAAGPPSQTWSSRGTGTGRDEPVLVGRSPAMQRLVAEVKRIARSSATVLVTGESGTGKELVAHLIHRLSPRARERFVAVNCPAVPGSLLEAELFGVERGVATGVDARIGRFEMAQRGTLFLDEVGDLDPAAQAKILRFLQERTIEKVGGRAPIPLDVRIVAATHHDLKRDVEEGRFRRDLYHRLKVVALELPPLRDRKSDIPLLIDYLLEQPRGPAVKVGPEALACLVAYDFPGNVRELEHALAHARLRAEGPLIGPADLPADVVGGPARAAPAAAPMLTSAAFDEKAQESTAPMPSYEVHQLFERITVGGESFWDLVQVPFLRRGMSRETARALIALAYRESGGSYKEMAKRLGVADQYKKLLNFMRNHDLGAR